MICLQLILLFGDLIRFTYERDDGLARSWVDHVVRNDPFVPSISDVHHVSFGTNLSDHFPVSFTVDFATISYPIPVCSHFSFSLSFDWANASESQLENFRTSVASTCPVYPLKLYLAAVPPAFHILM